MIRRAALLAFALGPIAARADAPPPPAVAEVSIDERLGQAIPLDLPFIAPSGRAVRLGDYFRTGRPVVLALVYDRCSMLCSLLLRHLARSLRDLSWRPGRDYEAITVSVDPTEPHALAAEKQGHYLQAMGDPGDTAAWPFLTGATPAITALTSDLGFRYTYDAETHTYAHGALLFVLTPGGRISRYLYGIDFPSSTLRLAFSEAGAGRFSASVDRILLTCFHYDPASRRYGVYVFGALRAGGAAVFAGLALLVGVLVHRERKKGAA